MVEFFRKIDASTDASDIIDTELNLHYPDLFNGSATTVDIQSKDSIGYYFINGKIAEKPQYGDAELSGLSAFLFLTDMDVTESYSSPSILAYKSKKTLTNEGQVTEQANGRDLLTFGAKMSGKRHLLESFDGDYEDSGEVTRVGSLVTYKTDPYLEFDYAWGNMDNNWTSPHGTGDEETFFATFGEYFQGKKIVRVEQRPSTVASAWQWTKNVVTFWDNGKDDDKNIWFPVKTAGSGYTSPFWQLSKGSSRIKSQVEVVEDTEVTGELSVDKSNSIFTYFHSQGDDKILIDEAGSEYQTMYSRPSITASDSKTGGHSLKLRCFWSKDESYVYYGKSLHSVGHIPIENDVDGYVMGPLKQTCGVTFTDIPMPIFNEAHTPSAHFSESRFNGPTALQTTWNRNDSIEDTEDYSLGNVPGKVVITFKINKLPYAREYWNPRFDQFVGEVKPWMHSMDRSFGFHLSEFIPMKKGRGRGAELHRDK